MNKFVVGVIAGVALGVAVSWAILSHHGPEAAKAEAKPPEKEKENPLHLVAEKRTAAGITMAKPTEVSLASEIPAFGRVLDPTPLVTLVAEQETARTAAAASEKEWARAKKLFAAGGNASAQAVEAAEAAANRDRALLASVRVRLLAGWGRPLTDVADIKYVTEALEKGHALVRLDLLPGEMIPSPPKTARVGLAGTSERVEATILGAAPVADPQLQGVGFLALAPDRAWPAGAALRATLAGGGEAQTRFTVPRSAIVYHQGSAWIFVLGEEDTFERKLVTLGRTMGDRVALVSGADDDDQVVITGAQQLLAAELQAGGAPEEH